MIKFAATVRPHSWFDSNIISRLSACVYRDERRSVNASFPSGCAWKLPKRDENEEEINSKKHPSYFRILSRKHPRRANETTPRESSDAMFVRKNRQASAVHKSRRSLFRPVIRYF